MFFLSSFDIFLLASQTFSNRDKFDVKVLIFFNKSTPTFVKYLFPGTLLKALKSKLTLNKWPVLCHISSTVCSCNRIRTITLLLSA